MEHVIDVSETCFQKGENKPLGLSRRNQSFFCSLVAMLMRVVVHSMLYTSFNSSSRIWTFCPLGVLCVIK